MFPRLGIRAKIAGGSFVIVIIASVISGLVLNWRVEQILRGSTETVLTNTAAPYVEAIHSEPSESLDDPGLNQHVAVVDPEGIQQLNTLPHELALVIQKTHLPEGINEVTADRTRFIVYVKHVSSAVGEWRIVSALPAPDESVVLSQMRALIVGALGSISCGVLVAAFLLTSAALRPVRRIRQSAEKLIDSPGNDMLPVGSVDDEIGRLARTLNDLIVALRASAQREKQLVSDASHELRTPLAILLARLELARTHPQSLEHLVDDVRLAENSVARLAGLVESLLQLSSIEAAAPAYSTVAELTDEVRDAIGRAEFQGHPILIRSVEDTASADPTTVLRVRSEDFGRVVDNLLNNAIRAMDDDGEVIVILHARSEVLTLSIADNGPGMPAEFVDRAFDRFSQGDTARTSGSGAGLGLPIAAAIVNHAHGRITLHNSPGHGLRVVVELPIAQPNNPEPVALN